MQAKAFSLALSLVPQEALLARFTEGHEALQAFFAEDHHEDGQQSRGGMDSGLNPLSFESHPGHHWGKNTQFQTRCLWVMLMSGHPQRAGQ